MEIGVQGVGGSFHSEAANAYFQGRDITVRPFRDFLSLSKPVRAKEVGYGMMAIGNTIEGTIPPNYALINGYGLKIAGEVYMRAEMSLIAHKGKKPEDPGQVYSHPVALLQCAAFLAKYPRIKTTGYGDTASSVKRIRDQKLTGGRGFGDRDPRQKH